MKLNYFAKKIKGFKSVYLAGGIEKAQKQDWRFSLERFFEKNKIKVFNPLRIDEKLLKSFKMKTKKELEKKSKLKYHIFLREIEEKDKFIIENKSDLVIFYLNGKEGFGTWTELKWCYDKEKRFMIVREEREKRLPEWIRWRKYFALAELRCIEFKSLSDLKEFFVVYFGFVV